MIEQNVQVVRCRDERVWVRMGSQTGCSACENGNGCGAGVFAKLLRRKQVVMELPRNGIKVEPGQMLTLSFPEQVYIKLVLGSYGWPLLAALVGAWAGYSMSTWLGLPPAWVDAGTLCIALLAGFAAQRLIRRRHFEDTVLGALQMTKYYPSATPDMCGSGERKSKQI